MTEPLRHRPTFLPPDLPDGQAECLVCGDWITAVDLVSEECPGPAAKDDILIPPTPRDAEREATVGMVARCGRNQR